MTARFFIVQLARTPRTIVGPVSRGDIENGLKNGSLSWGDLIWEAHSPNSWVRLFELEALRDLLSSVPDQARLDKYKDLCIESLKEEAKAVEHTKMIELSSGVNQWDSTKNTSVLKQATGRSSSEIVLTNPTPPIVEPVYVLLQNVEKGPFSISQMLNFIKLNQSGQCPYVWYRGLSTWLPYNEISAIQAWAKESKISLPSSRGLSALVVFQRETRQEPRFSMVASCDYQDVHGKRKSLGVCANISKTGIQVWLMEPLTAKPGDEILIYIHAMSELHLPEIQIRTRVLWYNEKELRLGGAFSNLENREKDLLALYFKSLQKSK